MFEYIHHVAYVVSDIDAAIRMFRDTFGMELSERRMMEGDRSVEMATFRCGPSLIEVLRPVNHPELERFLHDHGPGLHHVAFAVKDLSKRIEELGEKGVAVSAAFVAPTGWNIAYFDLANEDLSLLRSQHHGDHLAEAE